MPPWPHPFKAAVSFTMDNLGEAQDVLNNTWPHPIGTHPAVHTALPRMLDLLATHNLRATYFAESWSLAVYPAAVKELIARGHEVAWHGYQHEVWASLSDEEEVKIFEKSFVAARKAGVGYRGFRPPGGKINERTWGMLKERGMAYVSPLGGLGIGKGGVVVLPFEWKAVDAYYYMDTAKFREIRRELGDGEGVIGVDEFRDYVKGKIEEVKRTGGYLSVLFHPFLQTSEEKFQVMEEVVKHIAADGEIWSAPCKEVAEWVLENHASLGE